MTSPLLICGVRRAERRFIVGPTVAMLVFLLEVRIAGCCVEEANELLGQSLDGRSHGVTLRSYQPVHRGIELREYVSDPAHCDERLFRGRMEKKWGTSIVPGSPEDVDLVWFDLALAIWVAPMTGVRPVAMFAPSGGPLVLSSQCLYIRQIRRASHCLYMSEKRIKNSAGKFSD